MAKPSGQDLLDRLNTLKPSSVTLSRDPRPDVPQQQLGNRTALPLLTASSHASGAPLSREDALAARLKALRQAGDATTQAAATARPKEDIDVRDLDQDGERGEARPDDEDVVVLDDEALDALLQQRTDEDGRNDDRTEDRALREASDSETDDLSLEMLPDVPSSAAWLEGADGDSGNDEDNGNDAKQVEDLLRSLAGSTIQAGKATAKDDGGDSDDSDGDGMVREVRRVLEKARDEAGIGRDETEEETDGAGEDGNDLGLPSAPTGFVATPPSPSNIVLPSVPPKDISRRDAAVDDDDISARLAALRGLRGRAAGLGHTDAFGLPSAPTFQPGQEDGSVLKRGHFGHGRRNYTDADQQTWCVVCLEDATVRCLGCAEDGHDANNAYCARCWWDMHVGPAAGFDERGHQRAPLVR